MTQDQKIEMRLLSPALQAQVDQELRKTAALMLATLHRSQIARLANVLHQHCELHEVTVGPLDERMGNW